MSDTREHVWIVYFRRYSSDQWSAEVFPTEAQAIRFARGKYSSDQTAAQVRVKHYVEVEL